MASPRTLIRILVGAALCLALATFYGCLLLLTPAYSGVVAGRLPTEISTRGAKFAAEADQAAERDEEIVSELRQTVSQVVDGLTEAMIEIDRLKGKVTEDG